MTGDDISKGEVRERVWSRMVEEGVAAFPFPVEGRIPNFVGSADAAERLAGTEVFREADVLKVNPDSPQHPVRQRAVEEGKILYVPTPRLRAGFLRIDPDDVPEGEERRATTIKHSGSYGEEVPVEELEPIDLIVSGSVAVDRRGGRVGKGEGYSDLEYAILKEVTGGTPPVATTVHPVQLLEEVPHDRHDVPMDLVVTPEETVETGTGYRRPEGIDWSLLDEEDLEEMPVLRELRRMEGREG